MEEPELIYPAVELALQIRDKNDVSYSNIAVGEAFKPKLDDAPISAKCFLRNSISKKTFELESELIFTNAIGKISHLNSLIIIHTSITRNFVKVNEYSKLIFFFII